MRLSVELLPDAPAAEVLAAIKAADASAIDTVFCADELYHRDAWALLSAAARETRCVRLAPGVAHITLRDPLVVAQQLATLDELSGGRAAAAFSVGNLAMLAQCGRDPAGLRPAPRLREAHRAMRSLLDTGRVDLDGEFYSRRHACARGTLFPYGSRREALGSRAGGASFPALRSLSGGHARLPELLLDQGVQR